MKSNDVYSAVIATKDYVDTLQLQYNVVMVERLTNSFIYCHLQMKEYKPSFSSSICNDSLLKTCNVKCALFKQIHYMGFQCKMLLMELTKCPLYSILTGFTSLRTCFFHTASTNNFIFSFNLQFLCSLFFSKGACSSTIFLLLGTSIHATSDFKLKNNIK